MTETAAVRYDPPQYLEELAILIYNKRDANSTGEGRYRRTQGLRAAALEIGVSAATLSRIERGAVPDIESFRKICVWLGVSADQLLSLPNRAGGRPRKEKI